MDHEHVLGIYTYGLGDGLRGAPNSSSTGKFLVPGYSVRLDSHDYDALVTAIDHLISRFNWKGAIGLGLPGLLSSRDTSAAVWLPKALTSSDMEDDLAEVSSCSSQTVGSGRRSGPFLAPLSG